MTVLNELKSSDRGDLSIFDADVVIVPVERDRPEEPRNTP
jgi:hypothetical protein